MTNISSARGFELVSGWGCKVEDLHKQVCYVPATDATAIYKNAPVKLTTGSDPTGKCPTVTACTAVSDTPHGIMTAVVPNPALDPSKLQRVASKETYIEVCDDYRAIYMAQIAGTYAITDAAQNADILSTTFSGDSTTGISNCTLDTPTTTSTLQWQIIGLVPNQANEVGDYTKVYCKLNESSMALGRTGV